MSEPSSSTPYHQTESSKQEKKNQVLAGGKVGRAVHTEVLTQHSFTVSSPAEKILKVSTATF